MMTLFPKIFRSFALCMIMLLCVVTARAAEKAPVLVGLDGEFGLENSFSAQAIELGLRTAIAEINAAGGVLGGRPIELVIKDNRAILARSIRNNAEFASMPNLVAVFGGRFSPVILEQLPILKEAKLPYMVVWAAADPIIENGMQPNYVFRLAGSGATFGFAALGDAARVLELAVNPLLGAAHASTPTALSEVSRAVEALQRSLSGETGIQGV